MMVMVVEEVALLLLLLLMMMMLLQRGWDVKGRRIRRCGGGRLDGPNSVRVVGRRWGAGGHGVRVEGVRAE